MVISIITAHGQILSKLMASHGVQHQVHGVQIKWFYLLHPANFSWRVSESYQQWWIHLDDMQSRMFSVHTEVLHPHCLMWWPGCVSCVHWDRDQWDQWPHWPGQHLVCHSAQGWSCSTQTMSQGMCTWARSISLWTNLWKLYLLIYYILGLLGIFSAPSSECFTYLVTSLALAVALVGAVITIIIKMIQSRAQIQKNYDLRVKRRTINEGDIVRDSILPSLD